ncbi:hypothetical protein BDQ12DRAFT_680232 [Crucibulum laeve]|uniref:NAD-dependent epimerase/dehydratase domain-containing protein n=1 Tax=Crucibulum laeve TaxID=68775 RepID=A0A5C3M3N0_9AGAR|nr:hypothetical protein BDQ12DRAFT_680232 [Crucibulum laeve]
MKLAVTGYNGSVGKRVVALALKRGHTVVGIDRTSPQDADLPPSGKNGSSFSYHQADLTDFDAALKLLAGCDGVIALAALRNPTDYKVATHNNNVVISWNTLRACAELGINHIAQASSVNVMNMAYSKTQHHESFPIDETQPCLPDEPYGLSKVIMETQADTIVRRYPSLRVASLRLHYSVPDWTVAYSSDEKRKNDLWGYVQEDSAADAFLLAVTDESGKWSGHEPFFIVAPSTATQTESELLRKSFFPDVPLRKGFKFVDRQSFFDCSKAEKLLGWIHRDGVET